MNRTLTKELTLLTGYATLRGLRKRRPLLTGLMAAGTALLYYSYVRSHFSLKNKNVFITGGSRGLGLSLAWNVLAKGGAVTLVAREQEELQGARRILLADFPNGQIHIVAADITYSKQLASSMAQAIESMGSIDLLVNNAGSILVGPFESMETEDFEALMRLHLFSAIKSTQLILDHFKERGGGRILNICSLGGKVAVPHMLPYDASKFALAGFSQGVTAELAPHGIYVTTAYPTVMRTGSPIQAVFKGDAEKEYTWFASLDNMPGLSISADKAAKTILTAVEEGRTEIVLSLAGRARIILGALFPETVNAIMDIAARVLPRGNSPHRKTGADSAQIFERSRLLKSLHDRSQQAEIMYNQKPHHNAEEAMGVTST